MDFVICQYLPFLKIFSIAFANIIFPQYFINKFYQYLSFLTIFLNRFYPLEKCWVTPHCDSLTLRTQTNICPGQITLNNEILFSIVFSNIFSTMFEKLKDSMLLLSLRIINHKITFIQRPHIPASFKKAISSLHRIRFLLYFY